MLKRRHSSLMLAPSCSANLTNSSRLDMIDTSFQGMAVLQSSNGLIAYRCKPCPWTGVNDVPGLYIREGGGNAQLPGTRAQRALRGCSATLTSVRQHYSVDARNYIPCS